MEKKENQRIALTKRLVREALLIMLQKSAIQKITVRDLCAQAGINRTTFYNHYGSPEDVLQEMSRNFLDDIEDTLNSADIDDREQVHQRVVFVFRYMLEHLDMSRLLINSNLDSSFSERLFSIPRILDLLEDTLSSVTDVSEKMAIISFVVSGSYQLVQDWLNCDRRISPDEEARLVLTLANRVCTEK